MVMEETEEEEEEEATEEEEGGAAAAAARMREARLSTLTTGRHARGARRAQRCGDAASRRETSLARERASGEARVWRMEGASAAGARRPARVRVCPPPPGGGPSFAPPPPPPRRRDDA